MLLLRRIQYHKLTDFQDTRLNQSFLFKRQQKVIKI